LRVRLTARAVSQLAALPVPAGEKVARALRILEAAPLSGLRYPEDSPFHGSRYKTVVVRRRRWTYRITYTIKGDVLWVRYFYPSWYPMTHPDLAGGSDH
jgi:hypothetical protein